MIIVPIGTGLYLILSRSVGSARSPSSRKHGVGFSPSDASCSGANAASMAERTLAVSRQANEFSDVCLDLARQKQCDAKEYEPTDTEDFEGEDIFSPPPRRQNDDR